MGGYEVKCFLTKNLEKEKNKKRNKNFAIDILTLLSVAEALCSLPQMYKRVRAERIA